MSYLMEPRLSFRGRFLSDVPTRNNIRQNYELAAEQSDLWNKFGGASVELLDCRALDPDGALAGDPGSSYVVTGAMDRPSGKMVDLDPAWQMSSELWGMHLCVSDPRTGELAFDGKLTVCSFRDLWTRQLDPTPNGQRAGGRFVSTLDNVVWGSAAERSAAITRLRDTAMEGKLSIGMHTFGYFYTETHPRYRTGSVMVHIGPFVTGEPETALVHRRIMGFVIRREGRAPVTVTSDIDFTLSDDGLTGYFDLGHALRVSDVDGTLASLGEIDGFLTRFSALSIGVLPDPEPDLFSVIPPSLVDPVLDLPNEPEWYKRSGGIVTVNLPEAITALAEVRRLGLFARSTDGSARLVATETEDGVFCRPDHFVRRLDPQESTRVRFHARKFGKPVEGLTVYVAKTETSAQRQGLAVSVPEPTDRNGQTDLHLTASDPGNPRVDIDGQIFIVAYSHKVADDGTLDLSGTGLGALDVIPVHVRDPFEVPDDPEFYAHIRPFMAQYARLYPIMSEHLFDIADYDALVRHRRAMRLAFSRSIEDPNYMPVTRDLSRGKLDTLIKWLSTETGDETAPLRRHPPSASSQPAFVASAEAAEGQPYKDAKALMATVMMRGAHFPMMEIDQEEP